MRKKQSLDLKVRELGTKGVSPRARREQKKNQGTELARDQKMTLSSSKTGMVEGTWGLKFEPSRGKPRL